MKVDGAEERRKDPPKKPRQRLRVIEGELGQEQQAVRLISGERRAGLSGEKVKISTSPLFRDLCEIAKVHHGHFHCHLAPSFRCEISKRKKMVLQA